MDVLVRVGLVKIGRTRIGLYSYRISGDILHFKIRGKFQLQESPVTGYPVHSYSSDVRKRRCFSPSPLLLTTSVEKAKRLVHTTDIHTD